jgi:formylmethanofuran dehydrogenase subunit E
VSENDPNEIPYFMVEFAKSRIRAGERCERCGEREATLWAFGGDGAFILCDECAGRKREAGA